MDAFISLYAIIPTVTAKTIGNKYPIQPKLPSITDFNAFPTIPHIPKLLRNKNKATATAIHKFTSFTTFLCLFAISAFFFLVCAAFFALLFVFFPPLFFFVSATLHLIKLCLIISIDQSLYYFTIFRAFIQDIVEVLYFIIFCFVLLLIHTTSSLPLSSLRFRL